MAKKMVDPRKVFEPYYAQLKELQAVMKKRPWASDWQIEADLYGGDKSEELPYGCTRRPGRQIFISNAGLAMLTSSGAVCHSPSIWSAS